MPKPRVFVCSDIFGDDKDDGQSFIRLLLYSNLIDLRGFSCSYPSSHINHTFVISLVEDQFTQDMNFLRAVDPAYPTAASIADVIYQGKATTGAPTGGANTPGSDALIAAALEASPSDPLWVLNWGPYGDLAQALYDDPTIADNIRVYAISPNSGYNHDADAAAADWIISRLVPGQPLDDLWWIANNSSFRGMYCGSGGENLPDRNWAPRYAAGRGALGDFYLDFTWDLGWDGTNTGAKEGDTPSLLYVLDNHLVRGNGADPAHATGGWGGRFQKDAALGNNYWKDIPSGQTLGSYAGANTIRVHQTDFWNAFADRLALLGRPTFLTGETLANVTTNVTLAGRTSHPGGHTWRNWRSDRAMNAVNSGNFDYMTSTVSGGAALHYIDAELTATDYTVEGIAWQTNVSGGLGIMMMVDGTLAVGDGRFVLFGLDNSSPYDWRITKNINTSDENTSAVSQSSSFVTELNSPYRLRVRKRGMEYKADIREPGYVDGWQHILTWTDPGTAMPGGGGPGIRGNNTYRNGLIFARTNDGIVGATYIVEAADTVAATGMSSGSGIVGAVAITEAPDSVATASKVAVAGAVALTEAADTVSTAGAVRVVGAVAISEIADVVAMSSSSASHGDVVIAEAADTVVSAGLVRVAGSVAASEAADVVTFTGGSNAGGAVVINEASDTVVSAAVVPVHGALAANDNGDSVTAAGSVRIEGAVAATEGADSVAATIGLQLGGSVSVSELTDTILATAGVVIRAAATGSIDNDAVASSGIIRIGAVVQAQEQPDSIVFATRLGIFATASITEASDTVAAIGIISRRPLPPKSRRFSAERDRIWRAA